MKDIVAYSICFILVIRGIFTSVRMTKESRNIKFTLNRTIYYLSILISFSIVNFNIGKILTVINDIVCKYFVNLSIESNITKVILLILTYFIIHIGFYNIFKFIVNPLNKYMFRYSNLNILASVIGVFRGLIIILITFVGINVFNSTVDSRFSIKMFNDITAYDFIESKIYNRPNESNNILDSGEEEYTSTSNVLIYYNGVTLDDGIKSSDQIDAKAIELVKYKEKDIDKAKSLYVWIGSNIEYDYYKAEKTLNNEVSGNSGAIEAWITRRGICFDYACLYVAMAKEVGLKVRLVIGSAFDGNQYGPHAWNEVYLKDEDRWITVDPTFYMAGDYFDNENFYDDHIRESIAGEW